MLWIHNSIFNWLLITSLRYINIDLEWPSWRTLHWSTFRLKSTCWSISLADHDLTMERSWSGSRRKLTPGPQTTLAENIVLNLFRLKCGTLPSLRANCKLVNLSTILAAGVFCRILNAECTVFLWLVPLMFACS